MRLTERANMQTIHSDSTHGTQTHGQLTPCRTARHDAALNNTHALGCCSTHTCMTDIHHSVSHGWTEGRKRGRVMSGLNVGDLISFIFPFTFNFCLFKLLSFISPCTFNSSI
ncbi:hypothetical protein I3842_07G074400 [Carya illinoinensis]|uniref:Uncharacterized protein n=1 Tax=Carya illinoinensis TaxID=32201 RepID=A0A922JD43_CARIL|nr:hypothetical protein I3842_07G074400 [Carya illinoinensis]